MRARASQYNSGYSDILRLPVFLLLSTDAKGQPVNVNTVVHTKAMSFTEHIVEAWARDSVPAVKHGLKLIATRASSAVAIASINMNTFVRLKRGTLRSDIMQRRLQHEALIRAAEKEKEEQTKKLRAWRAGGCKGDKPSADFEARNALKAANGNEEWKRVVEHLLRCAQGIGLDTLPGKMLDVPEFAEMMAALPAEPPGKQTAADFPGWNTLLDFITTEVWTSITNSVDQAEEAAINFVKRLVTKKQSKLVKKAAYDKDVSLNGWRGACRDIMDLLRELTQEVDQTNRLLLSWLLRLKMIATRDALHGRRGVPKLKAVVLVPQTKFTRRYVRYDMAGLKALLRWTGVINAGELVNNLSYYFNFMSAAFPADTNVHPPRTFLSDGTNIHFVMEEWVPREPKPGEAEETAAIYRGRPAIVSGEPKVMTSPKEVLEAGLRGCANGEALMAAVRDVVQTPKQPHDADITKGAGVVAAIVKGAKIAGADPGNKRVFSFGTGEVIDLGLCYQNKHAGAAHPQRVKTLEAELAKHPLSVWDDEKYRAAVVVRVAAIPDLIEYYCRQQACHQRNHRRNKRKSLYARIAHSILYNKNGELRFEALAVGANYMGGNSLRGVNMAGPPLVKAVIRELSRHILIIFGTRFRLLPVPCCFNGCSCTPLQWTST